MSVPDPFHNASPLAVLAAIVESSDDAIVSKDLEGTITTWNRGAERLFGYTAEEMIGHSIVQLIPADRADEEADILRRIRGAEKVDHFETVRRRKDGSLVDVSVTVSPIRDQSGVVVGASKVVRDITERRLAERVHHEADQRRNEFLAMLGHELRNPLAAIRSSLAVIRHAECDSDTTTAAEQVVDRQVAQLGRLVDDLLDADPITPDATLLDQIPGRRSVSTPRRILIVDDNTDAADMLKTLLQFNGHEVHAVHDGEAAVVASASLAPDVILLDIGLPKLNGYEAARRIRAHQGNHPPVIIALTGWGKDADRRQSADAGFDAHWVKPVDDQKLERFLAGLTGDPSR
jgi:PAS domain S-box-containing protein